MQGRDVSPELLTGLVGPAAEKFLDGHPHDDTYWLRVWGARGLLWSWSPVATDTVRDGLTDAHWRVREMSAKVIARHLLASLFDDVSRCVDDPVPRVRAAASRAIARITAAGA
jgi:hypothetical protein